MMGTPTLDRDQPYGTVYGKPTNNAKFTQNGLDFDQDGKCITTAPKDITSAKKLIDAASNPPAQVVHEPAPPLDVQSVRFTHRGGGKYDVYGTDGSVLADNITLEEAEKMVPTQVGDENLIVRHRSDLIARVNQLGGKVERRDTSETLIKKIKGLLRK